ncbi:hypothetical protein QQ020_10350 [Fulvivirgaceae bacterium BMA12]|uniref:Uncharacterized protein n=1 Tax=Agaribacillus aureus TaxID=3051825 RepID=A0ABT8L3Z6_9BACT|nr:hypothetical protein [Fulvivirgaceae bacterium BMA12]
MGRTSIFFILLIIFWLAGHAGLSRDLNWYEGTVIFVNQTQKTGELHLNMDLGLLLIKESNGIKTFPAFKVKYVELYDDKMAKMRSFISLPYKSSRFNQASNLFEVVLQGELFVLRRQQNTFDMVLETNLTGKYPNPNPFDKEHYVYYLYDGFQLTKLRHLNKKRLSSLVEKYGIEVDSYAKRKRINYKDTFGRIQVIAYYNAISQCKKEGDC